LVLSSAAQDMGIILAQGMGIMDHRLPTAIPLLYMATPLRPMAMGILITDRGTIPDTDTAVIMAGEAMVTVVMGIGGRSVQVCSLTRARPERGTGGPLVVERRGDKFERIR
jgi:hypothetical protein